MSTNGAPHVGRPSQLDIVSPRPWRRFVPAWIWSLICGDNVARYDAFLSYSWKADASIAPVVQSVFQQFLRPWYKLRAKVIFRDLSNLPAGSSLENELRDRLDRSAHLIVFACREAATSAGMELEAHHWFSAPREGQVLIIVTGENQGRWPQIRDELLPPSIRQNLVKEPLWVSIHHRRAEISSEQPSPRLREALIEDLKQIFLRLYQPRTWEELRGEERLQRRRALALMGGVLATTSLLALFAMQNLYRSTLLLVASQTDRAQQLESQSPGRAAALYASAVKEAEPVAFGFMGLQMGQRTARIALGRYLRDRSPLVLWFDSNPSHAEFDRTGRLLLVVAGRCVEVFSAVDASIVKRHCHQHAIKHATFSPAGRLAASIDSKGIAQVWELDGPAAPPIEIRHGSNTTSAAFDHTGSRMLTLGTDHQARLWEVATGKAIGPPWRHGCEKCWKNASNAGEPNATGYALRLAVFAADGATAITASDTGTLQIWDTSSGAPLGPLLAHEKEITSLEISPDGTLLMSASKDRTTRLWSAKTGELVWRMDHPDWVWSACFDGDGRRIVTSGRDGVVRTWELASRLPLREFVQGGLDFLGVKGARFSPSGDLIVTAGSDHTARLWDGVNRLPRGSHLEHAAPLVDALFSPDGRRVVTLGKDKTVRIWTTNSADSDLVLPHSPGVVSVKPGNKDASIIGDGVDIAIFAPDGKTVFTAGSDGRGILWDASSGQVKGTEIRHAQGIRAVSFSHDGLRIVTGSEDGAVLISDAQTGRPVTPLMKHTALITRVEFSHNDEQLLVASDDGLVRIWNATNGTSTGIDLRHSKRVNMARFSSDGRHIVTGSDDGRVRVWPLRGALAAESLVLEHGGAVEDVVLSTSGTRLISAGTNQMAVVFDLTLTPPKRIELQHEDTYYSQVVRATFSRDERHIATVGLDNTVRIWDAMTGLPLGEPLRHRETVNDAAFSPDGALIASASDDGGVRLWDIRTGRQVGPALTHRWVVNTVQFSTDGRRLLSGSMDGTARVWDLTPSADNASLLRMRVEVATALVYDARGNSLTPLSRSDWIKRRDAQTAMLNDRRGAP